MMTWEEEATQVLHQPQKVDDIEMPAEAGRLMTPEAVKNFILAGRARVTLVSKKTGTRFTYKVSHMKEKINGQFTGEIVPLKWFVNLLNGPSNTEDFIYLGVLDLSDIDPIRQMTLRQTAASRVASNAPSFIAFAWMCNMICRDRPELPPDLEVWHEGRCGRCGRVLTVPSSIAMGIGPECASKM